MEQSPGSVCLALFLGGTFRFYTSAAARARQFSAEARPDGGTGLVRWVGCGDGVGSGRETHPRRIPTIYSCQSAFAAQRDFHHEGHEGEEEGGGGGSLLTSPPPILRVLRGSSVFHADGVEGNEIHAAGGPSSQGFAGPGTPAHLWPAGRVLLLTPQVQPVEKS